MQEPTVPGTWQLTVCQPTAGYRFSLDAFLLADFVSVSTPHPLLDLGTGCGIIALFLARRFPATSIVALELQEALVVAARQNVLQNNLAQQVRVVRADARQARSLFPAGSFGTVVCNPPYHVVGSGRLNPDAARAVARHEVTLTLIQWTQACQHLLAKGGLLVLVYHPSRLPELCAELEAAHLRPRRMRLVHSTPHTPASMVLLEAVRAGRDALTVFPPLFVYDTEGNYTAEMQAIFDGRSLQGQNPG